MILFGVAACNHKKYWRLAYYYLLKKKNIGAQAEPNPLPTSPQVAQLTTATNQYSIQEKLKSLKSCRVVLYYTYFHVSNQLSMYYRSLASRQTCITGSRDRYINWLINGQRHYTGCGVRDVHFAVLNRDMRLTSIGTRSTFASFGKMNFQLKITCLCEKSPGDSANAD